jgi:hypothetical protein
MVGTKDKKGEIPKDKFRKLYKQFICRKITKDQFLNNMNVSESTLCLWRDFLKLGRTPRGDELSLGDPLPEMTKELQENFNTEYSKLKNKPRVKKDICYKLNIGNNTYKKLKDDYLANELESKGAKLIPLNFEKEYMKYCNGEINRKELCIKFDIGETLMYKWRKLLGLPIKRLKKEIVRYE